MMYDNPKFRESNCSSLTYDIPKACSRRSSSGISSSCSSYAKNHQHYQSPFDQSTAHPPPPLPPKTSAVPSPPRALPPPPPDRSNPYLRPAVHLVDSGLTQLCTDLLDAIDRGHNNDDFSQVEASVNARFRSVLGSTRDQLIRLAPDPRMGPAAAKYALEVGAILGVVESSRDHVTRALAHRRLHEGTKSFGTVPRRLSTLVRSFREATGAILKNSRSRLGREGDFDLKSVQQQQLRIMLRAVLLVKSRLAELNHLVDNENEQHIMVTPAKSVIYESIPKCVKTCDEMSRSPDDSTINQLIAAIRSDLNLDREEAKTPFEVYRTCHEKLCSTLNILEASPQNIAPAAICREVVLHLARSCVDALSHLTPHDQQNGDVEITNRFRLIVDQVESLPWPDEYCNESSCAAIFRTLGRASTLTFEALSSSRDSSTT